MDVASVFHFRKFWQYAAIAFLIAIFILSSIPSLTPPPLGFAWQDKLYHFAEYAVLSFLLFMALFTSIRASWKPNAHLLATLVAVAYAASDEIHQSFVTNRNGDFWDWVADGTGVITVQIIAYIIIKLSKSRRPTSLSQP